MTDLTGLIEFEPQKLRAAREHTQELHPGTVANPTPADETLLTSLRARIAGVQDDEQGMRTLARSLAPRELRAVIEGIPRWQELRSTCDWIIRKRLSASVLSALWSTWQRFPKCRPLREILVDAGERYGWEKVVSRPYMAAVADWVVDPETAIPRWLDEQGLSFSDMSDLVGKPIKPETPLGRLVRDSIMVGGSRDQLALELHSLVEWEKELSPEDAIRFGRNYLKSFEIREWHRPVLDVIKLRYGLPRKPRVERFWEGVSPELRTAFQRLYIEKRVEEELGHDSERARFWTRWAGDMVDVERGDAGRVRYAHLDFGGFVVVEFFETGNAAYFYLPEDAEQIRKDAPRSPSDLKLKRFYGIGGGDNRLIHSPPNRWHAKGDRMVSRWIKRMGGRRE